MTQRQFTAQPFAVFMLIADGEVDQLVDDNKIAQKEKRDLEAMGCKVRVRIFHGETAEIAWQKAHEAESRIRGY